MTGGVRPAPPLAPAIRHAMTLARDDGERRLAKAADEGTGADHFAIAWRLTAAGWLGCALLQLILYLRPSPYGGPFLVAWKAFIVRPLVYELLAIWLIALPFLLALAGPLPAPAALAALAARPLGAGRPDGAEPADHRLRPRALPLPRPQARPQFPRRLRRSDDDGGQPVPQRAARRPRRAVPVADCSASPRRRSTCGGRSGWCGAGPAPGRRSASASSRPCSSSSCRSPPASSAIRSPTPASASPGSSRPCSRWSAISPGATRTTTPPGDPAALARAWQAEWLAGSADKGWRFPDPAPSLRASSRRAPSAPAPAERWNVIIIQLESVRGIDTGHLRPGLRPSPTPYLDTPRRPARRGGLDPGAELRPAEHQRPLRAAMLDHADLAPLHHRPDPRQFLLPARCAAPPGLPRRDVQRRRHRHGQQHDLDPAHVRPAVALSAGGPARPRDLPPRRGADPRDGAAAGRSSPA